ncbi:FHA domain-containing protein [Blautia sp. MSJ-9]|uniref:FHA domain-containing protein n=1 Tax=Blautia sp. MSJ-9 TaxID=2841511 RepID=UPI001C1246EE|nr:FHA domain-containing protein [Blautia sp. MSJ-9]MBU5679200.1 FHA domain-containing protein [Blautia sp. MSJ-9]
MEFKQCEKGHYYESTLTRCPQCEREAMEQSNETMDFNQSGGKASDYRPTESFSFPEVEDYGPTAPVGMGTVNSQSQMGNNGGETRPPENYGFTVPGGNPFGDTLPQNTTSVYMNDQAGFLPVVGWLVCIEGPEKGKDYRIHAGYNSIGRSFSMDIVLKYDNNISREKDCYIGYDQQEKEFFFGHDNGRNIIRVNGKRVNGSTDLKSYDILSIGSCKYMFVALCGEQFDWSDEE